MGQFPAAVEAYRLTLNQSYYVIKFIVESCVRYLQYIQPSFECVPVIDNAIHIFFFLQITNVSRVHLKTAEFVSISRIVAVVRVYNIV